MNDHTPPTKLSALIALMDAGDWVKAIGIASKFGRLGDESKAIMQAQEAIARPSFQKQLGRDPDMLIALGIEALNRRYRHA